MKLIYFVVTMTKKAKIVYYVDTDDNTKSSLCAVPSNKDIRGQEMVSELAEMICETFAWNLLICEHCTNIAKSIAFYGFASFEEYEFGIEEVPLIDD